MNRYYFLAEDYRCFKRRLDEIERMIRELSAKDDDADGAVNDPYHENFIYTERSRSQFMWCRRLMELIHIRDNARIVSPANRENRILPGKKATYRIENTNTVRSMVVGSYFNFIMEEAVPCSHPLAWVLTGKKTGETCTATIRGKTLRLSVVDIGFPCPMN